MTAQQLKNSILQMAVQGKLVPQDPNDEPASVLLERIRAEKEQLIKQKKIKREKNPSVIFKGADNTPYEKIGTEVRSIADEIPFDIPETWEWVRCSSLGEIVRGSGIKRTETTPSGMPCVRYGELYTSYSISFTEAKSFIPTELDAKCKHFSYGDILMTLTGENKPDIAKAVAYLGDTSIAAGGDLAYWTAHGMNPLYLVYVMSSPYVIARKVDLATGDIIVHISGEKIGSILIPIPPLEEQERIVQQIEELTSFVTEYGNKEAALSELQTRFPEQLKKSILQMAVQGKLVPQNPTDEPASILLDRIRAEKDALIKSGKIKHDKHESVIFRRDNSHYEKLDGVEHCINDELPFEIPDSWTWVRLGSIGDWGSGATPSRTHPEYYDGSIPWLKTGDLTDSYITDIPEGISQLALEMTSVRLNESGSVLMAMYGATIGKLGILTYPATTNQACCACKPVYGVETLYLFYFLMSQRAAFIKRGEGGAQPNISKEKIVATLMPLPPLAEQHRIVQRIEELLPLVKGV